MKRKYYRPQEEDTMSKFTFTVIIGILYIIIMLQVFGINQYFFNEITQIKKEISQLLEGRK